MLQTIVSGGGNATFAAELQLAKSSTSRQWWNRLSLSQCGSVFRPELLDGN
jgi:hypothetical protein